MTDQEAEAMSEAIKNMEPALRVAGKTPDFSRFSYQFHSGQFSDEKTLQSAIDNSASVKIEWEHGKTPDMESRVPDTTHLSPENGSLQSKPKSV